eukprot:TRINITY_DN3880_c0_g1_i1.p1 TRINITY_DN3880_c0_g1~~TRINITY_DN3880_c0_g1_i1.p1  ORF type:complete len:333 (+),score=53.20 TRINITY_DN3880_c0_g1_i1:99-1097(+)
MEARVVAGLADGTLCLVDTDAVEEVGRFDTAQPSAVWSTAASPNTRWLASGCGNGAVYLHNLASRTLASAFLGHSAQVSAVSWSPDSAYFLTGADDGTARVWRSVQLDCAAILTDHRGRVKAIAVCRTNTRLATSATDGFVHVYHVGAWQKLLSINVGRECFGLCFNPQLPSVFAVGASDGTVKTYDAITAQLTRVFDGHKNGATVNSVEFSQAGTRLLSASDNTAVTLHDFATGAVLLKLKKKDIVNMVRVCFSCDERSIIAACLAHGMKIFSCETGGLLQSITCASPVYSVAVTPPPATFLVHAHARRRPDDASAAAQQRPTKRVRTART